MRISKIGLSKIFKGELLSKRYTLLFLTQDHNKVRKFSLPGVLFRTVAICASLLVLVLSWIMYDYIKVKKEVGEVYDLKTENQNQKIQLQSLVDNVHELELQMAKLSQFDWKLRNIANLNPSAEPDQLLGKGGPSPEEYLSLWNTTENADLVSSQLEMKISRLEEDALNREKSFNELHEYLLDQETLLASTPSIWPTKGWLASGFGHRTSPFTGLRQRHQGVDIANRTGIPVIATADGLVVTIGKDWALGKYVMINHGYGLKTKYGHLSKVDVKRGQKIKRGDLIGAMGSTGRSTGPHLHYEVLVNNVPVNPMKYILN
jgi:murein DD-endopeptidase MepM/ murein hydrolase activator NlpD